jgi:hypothetical protein
MPMLVTVNFNHIPMFMHTKCLSNTLNLSLDVGVNSNCIFGMYLDNRSCILSAKC